MGGRVVFCDCLQAKGTDRVALTYFVQTQAEVAIPVPKRTALAPADREMASEALGVACAVEITPAKRSGAIPLQIWRTRQVPSTPS